MMRGGSLSALTITGRSWRWTGAWRGEERGGEGKKKKEGARMGGKTRGSPSALAQHCQCEAMRLNYKCLGFSGIH